MADQDFNIKVVTTADVSALRLTSDEIRKIREEQEKVKQDVGAASLFARIPPKAVEDVKGIADAAAKSGVNLGLAGKEAGLLARELAEGNVNARTLGSLLHSLSIPGALAGGIAGLAAVGVGAFKIFEDFSKFQEKLNADIRSQQDELSKLSIKWTEAAKSVETYAEAGHLLSGVTGEIDRITEKTAQLNNQTIGISGALGEAIISIFSVTAKAWTPFTDALNQAIEEQKKLKDAAIETSGEMVRAAEASQIAWENIRLEPVEQAIKELTASLEGYKSALASTDTTTEQGIALHKFYAERIADTESKIKQLTGTEKQLEDSIKRVSSEIEKSNFDKLSDTGKLDALSTKLKEINEDLETLGVKSKNAADILEEAKGLSPEDAKEAVKLAEDLVKTNEEISKTTEKITKDTDDWNKLRSETLQDAKEQLAIDQAAATGNTQLVNSLKEQRDIRRQITDLMSKGLSFEEASNIASAEAAIKEQSRASAQVQAILRNEAAAKDAREQGRQRDADLLQKTADTLKRSASPEQLAELERIKKLTEPVERPGRTAEVGESQALVDALERNRIAAEKQAAAVDAAQEKPIEKAPGDFESREANRQAELDQRAKENEAARIERETQLANKDRPSTSDPELKTISGKLDQLISLWR